MARITSDASGTELRSAIPDGTVCRIRLTGVKVTHSKQQDDGTGNNPMIVTAWEVAEGPYKGRRLGLLDRNVGHVLMIGGKTKAGDDMPIFRLLEFIDALKLPWTGTPDGRLVVKPFKKVKVPETGVFVYVDPDTDQRLVNVEYDPGEEPHYSNWVGKECMATITVQKEQGGDREFNRIGSLSPLP